jgi:hypothetical protein
MKNIPLLAINHTYKEIGLFPKDVVSGGTGIYYSADNIWIIGRRQNKEGTDVIGYDFVINVEKSRYVREKSAIPIKVLFDGGICNYSGLLDVALAGGYVTKPSNGWYTVTDTKTGEVGQKVRAKDTLEPEFWEPVFRDTDFKEFIKRQYQLGYSSEPEIDMEAIANGHE